MSYAQNYRSLLGVEPRHHTTYALSGRDTPLDDLEPVYIPPSNDAPFSRDAYRPLNHPNRSPEALDERLYDDLCNGVYECSICIDTIDIESQMWSCKYCHHIYHFTCAKEWAQKRKNSTASTTWRWPCPTCKRLQNGGDHAMTPTCWCGRWRHYNVQQVIGNSCGKKCSGYSVCKSPGPKCERFCQKLCHPGPCEEVQCVSTCILKRFPNFRTEKKKPAQRRYAAPQQLRAAYTAPARAGPGQARPAINRAQREATSAQARNNRQRRRSASDSDADTEQPPRAGLTWGPVVFLFILLGALETGLAFWISYHIERFIHPLKHRDYVEHRRIIETVAGVLFGAAGVGAIKLILYYCTLRGAYKLLTKKFGLGPLSSRKTLMFMFGVIVLVAGVIWFPIAFLGGADVAWYNQMRRSCEGFDTRIKLDGPDGETMAAASFFLYQPNFIDRPAPRGPGIDTFNFTKPLKSKHAKISPDPFYSYHRLTGAFSSDEQMYVDFDLNHFTWRIMSPANAINGKTETLVRNGTWTNTTSSHPHVTLPELNLQLPNFHFFKRKCHYQPFMTVFRTDGMEDSGILKQSEKDWSSKSEGNVVMRTASFGHGQHGLEVCARRADYEGVGKSNQMEMRKGLNDDVIIPLGLIAAVRRQMRMEDNLPGNCWDR